MVPDEQARGGYFIKPKPVASLTEEEVADAGKDWSLGGCLGWSLLIFFFFFTIAASIPREEAVIWILGVGAVVSLLVPPGIYGALARERQKREVAALTTRREELSEQRATSLTSRVHDLRARSVDLLGNLPQHIDRAQAALAAAEGELGGRAFGPFWDAVERAAAELASFGHDVDELQRDADTYYELLAGEEHNFPHFPVRDTGIPSPEAAVAEFRRLLRLGQTDFEFASIWEQRRTRTALVRGFRTLGEAVGNLEMSVESSIGQLGEALGSDAGELRREVREFHGAYKEYASREADSLSSIERKLPPSVS